MIRPTLLIGMLLTIPHTGVSQNKPHPQTDEGAGTPAVSTQKVAVHQITFGTPTVVQGMMADPSIMLPIKCGSNATAFVDMLSSKAGKTSLYAIHEGKGVIVDAHAINDLKDVSVTDVFPARSESVFLVRGLPLKGPGSDEKKGDHPFFAAVFDAAGQYKNSVALPTEVRYTAIALLDSGEIVLQGFDLLNELPRLQIVSRTGQVIRIVDQPMKMTGLNTTLAKELAALSTSFTRHGENILAWRTGSNDPVLEISSGPTVRDLRLDVPKGKILQYLVSSEAKDSIVATVSTNSMSSGEPNLQPQAVENEEYLEFSSLDGSLIQKLTFGTAAVGSIACKTDGQYLAYATNTKNQLLEFRGQ